MAVMFILESKSSSRRSWSRRSARGGARGPADPERADGVVAESEVEEEEDEEDVEDEEDDGKTKELQMRSDECEGDRAAQEASGGHDLPG